MLTIGDNYFKSEAEAIKVLVKEGFVYAGEEEDFLVYDKDDITAFVFPNGEVDIIYNN